MIDPDAWLTPAELLMHRLHERSRGGSIITAAARFTGCLGPDSLGKALSRLQQRHPILRVRIQESGAGAHFEEVSKPVPIPLLWSETDRADDWSLAAQKLGSLPFELSRGTLIRVQVLYHPGLDVSDVILASHHAITDGRSVLLLYREIALLCAGDELPPPAYPGLRPVPRVPGRHGLIKPVLAEAFHRLRLWPELRRYPLARLQFPPQKEIVMHRRVWKADATARLRVRAKQEGTTLFGALCAATTLTLCQWYGVNGRSVEIRSTLDIRNYCAPPISDDHIGCYASILFFMVTRVDQRSFWELSRAALQGARRVIDLGLWAAGWRLLGRMLKWGHTPPVRPIFCLVNNIGECEEVRTSGSRLIEFSVSANQEGLTSSFKLIAATVAGALNLTIHSPWHSPAEVDRIFDQILQRLDLASAP